MRKSYTAPNLQTLPNTLNTPIKTPSMSRNVSCNSLVDLAADVQLATIMHVPIYSVETCFNSQESKSIFDNLIAPSPKHVSDEDHDALLCLATPVEAPIDENDHKQESCWEQASQQERVAKLYSATRRMFRKNKKSEAPLGT